MTRPRKSVTDGYATLRGAWPSVAAAKLPANVDTLVVDGELQDLTGVLDLPDLLSLELRRWARPLDPLAGHQALRSLNIDAAGDFGSLRLLADIPALEMLFIGVPVEDVARVAALMDQIPWPHLTQLRHVSIGAAGWQNEPLAGHDIGFITELERLEHASLLGSVLSDPDSTLTRARLPGALRELHLIEREPGELDAARGRLAKDGIELLVLGVADQVDPLAWPPTGHPPFDEEAIAKLIDDAVLLGETDDGWALSVRGTGLPIVGTMSQLRNLLVARTDFTADIVVDVEGSELTILGRDLDAGQRWKETVIAIMRELWGL